MIMSCQFTECAKAGVKTCQSCKKMYCEDHLDERSFVTADGKQQFGRYCVYCEPTMHQIGNQSGTARPFLPWFMLAVVVIIIIAAVISNV